MYSPATRSELFRGRGWVVLLRGVTAIAFGVLAAVGPRVTLSTLVVLFGIYALVHGILSLAAAVGGRGQQGSVLLAVEGVVGLVAGALTMRRLHPSIMAFVFLVWLWAIATGILRIAEAVRLRKEIPGDIWLALSGVVPVFLALLLFAPRIIGGTVGLALLIAIPAVIWGVFEILLGYELRAARFGPSTRHT